MNESNKPTKEEQDPLMSKPRELSGRIVSIQKSSRNEEFFKEIIKYLKIIKRDIAVYFIFTCILLYHEHLRKILSVIF